MLTSAVRAWDDETASSPEAQLCEYVQRLQRHREGRRAVQIHLSQLRPQNRLLHHLRIAANTFHGLVSRIDGQFYTLSNGDIFFLCRDEDGQTAQAAVLKVCYLFSDDPLAEQHDPMAEPRFCTWYQLAHEYVDLTNEAQRLYEAYKQRRKAEQAEAISRDDDEAPAELHPMTPAELGEIERSLDQADLTNLMRRQSICAITGNEPPKPVIQEVFVSIAEMQQQMTPTVNLTADRWLFQRLTQLLDRRMLALILKHEDTSVSKFLSINLNVSSLLSDDFLRFDEALRANARGTILLEVPVVDIFSDMAAYTFARDFVHDRAYRICIDGVTHQTAPLVNRAQLGADMIKLYWSPQMLQDDDGSRRTMLTAFVKESGRANVVLCRCDTVDAIVYGRDLGICLFQGHYIDALLQVESERDASNLTFRQARSKGRATTRAKGAK